MAWELTPLRKEEKNGAGDGDRTRDIQLGKLRHDRCRRMKEVREATQKSRDKRHCASPAPRCIFVLIHENEANFVDVFVDFFYAASGSEICSAFIPRRIGYSFGYVVGWLLMLSPIVLLAWLVISVLGARQISCCAGS